MNTEIRGNVCEQLTALKSQERQSPQAAAVLEDIEKSGSWQETQMAGSRARKETARKRIAGWGPLVEGKQDHIFHGGQLSDNAFQWGAFVMMFLDGTERLRLFFTWQEMLLRSSCSSLLVNPLPRGNVGKKEHGFWG